MSRTLLALALAVMTALVGFAQDKKDDKKPEKKDDKKAVNLYPLAKGTKWEYKLSVGGMDIDATKEVTEVSEPKKGERAVSTLAIKAGPQDVTEEMSADDKGVYKHASMGQKLDTPILAVKYPVKVGDKWSEKLKLMGQEVEADFETKEAEKVKVAAGEYSAYPVVTTIKTGGQTITATAWYADGVGVVKEQMEIGGNKITTELTKFTAAK